MASQQTRSSRNTQRKPPRRRNGITYRGQKATHQTAGLPGYPAVDIFAKPGTPFLAPEKGRVVRWSGRGGTSGQVFGYTVYFKGVSGRMYFITHLNYDRAPVGSVVQAGGFLGSVSAWSGGATHAHVGINTTGADPGTGDTGAGPPSGYQGGQSGMSGVPNAPQLPEFQSVGGPVVPNAPPPPEAPMPDLPGRILGPGEDDISLQWRMIAAQPLSSPESQRWAGLLGGQ